jgi:hypothetical protein
MTRPAPQHPNLAWLLDVVWGPALRDGAIDGASAYRVIPSARRARMLVPADDAVATVALRAGGGTRSPRAQRARSIAAMLLRTGAFRDRVWVEPDDPLRAEIAGACGVEAVLLACAVRRPSPFRKPMLQVLTHDGRVIAYAKVAWNAVTAANVAAEHVALAGLHAHRTDRVAAPVPIALVEHRGFPLLLTEPMPERLRRYDRTEPPPDPAVALAVSRVLGASAGPDPIGARLRARLAATAPTDLATVHAGTTALLDALGSAGAGLSPGAWHGDWSPWNLGWVEERLWAWDWEYCRADVPVGLDAPHFVFQRRFIGDRAPLERAFTDAAAGAAPALAALGYGPAERAIVHAVHVAEVALRYLEAASTGVAANPRFVAGAERALRGAIDGLP